MGSIADLVSRMFRAGASPPRRAAAAPPRHAGGSGPGRRAVAAPPAPAAGRPREGSILLVLPVPFLDRGGALQVEAQARNGLGRWADNFDSVVLAAPILPDALARLDRSTTWEDVSHWAYRDRVEFVPLPWAYRVSDFLRAYRRTRRALAGLIDRCEYLHFAVGGVVGDWASVAASEAWARGRGYAFFTDNVPHRVMRAEVRGSGFRRQLKAMALAPLTRRVVATAVRRSDVALLHGADCFEEYKQYCRASFLVHNIHTKPSDGMSDAATRAKAARAGPSARLRVCYTGRMVAIKGPLEWVWALAAARDLGADVEATWLGDGPLLAEARALVRRLGLDGRVLLPGHVADRARVLETTRDSHLMLFCHLTSESPRCLLESMVCATPIVGYRSRFAEELIQERGGGVLAPVHDWRGLGEVVAGLDRDRDALAGMIREAGRNGSRFNDVAVFRERSDLIKAHLGGSAPGRA